jgi:hypothetical protein
MKSTRPKKREKMSHSRISVTFGAALLLFAAAAPIGLADECIDCHGAPEFKVQQKLLYDYVQDFNESIHGLAELACSDCHGGDGTTTDFDTAHVGVKERVRFDKIPETCGSCHEEQLDNFSRSHHYQILMNEGTAPNCVTCHGSMEMDFIFSTRVRDTCLHCHNDETGTLPDIPNRADKVLSQINIIKGYKSFVAAHLKDKQRAQELQASYSRLSGHWHGFKMDRIEVETKDLLGELRKAKNRALKDKRG